MIGISMRMTRHVYPSGGEEFRDALAQDWWIFLDAVLPGVPVVPLPNIGKKVEKLLEQIPLSGLVLSGGDDWGVFPQRDLTEKTMVQWTERRKLPILGVCRGAQVLNLLHGGQVSQGFGPVHSCTRHLVHPQLCAAAPGWPGNSVEVNSYHALGIRQKDLAPDFSPCFLADDGSVEGFCSADGRITGILWHPEREALPQSHDIPLFQILKQENA